MRRVRVIPTLLMHDGGLVKSVKFKDYNYIGDPINAVRIFNDKEVDELIILDIDASAQSKAPDLTRITELASECFMPLAYGGGITTLDQIKQLFNAGIEKVVLNNAAYHTTQLITDAATIFGNQSIVVSVDVRKNLFGNYYACVLNGNKKVKLPLKNYIKALESAGAGEIMLTSIDQDGTYKGYDLTLIRQISELVEIPVIASGGAGRIEDFEKAIIAGASAVAAGSLFVYHGRHKAVLISYPEPQNLEHELFNKLN